MPFSKISSSLPDRESALPGRAQQMPVPAVHAVNGHPLSPPWPEGHEEAWFALGCFWGAERRFWQTPGVYVTAVGYVGGITPNPTYEEVCSGLTGHAEAVRVVYDPKQVTYADLLKVFWEAHDPTQGMRQGNDRGTQYRSMILTLDSQQQTQAEASKDRYQTALDAEGLGRITTQIQPAGTFYYAEPYHQQYLHKHPRGYCGLGGLEIPYPVD